MKKLFTIIISAGIIAASPTLAYAQPVQETGTESSDISQNEDTHLIDTDDTDKTSAENVPETSMNEGMSSETTDDADPDKEYDPNGNITDNKNTAVEETVIKNTNTSGNSDDQQSAYSYNNAAKSNSTDASAKKKGWVKNKNGTYSYYDKKGKPYTGWHKMGKAEGEKESHWSYFDEKGRMMTGWVQFGKGTKNPDGDTEKHWSYFGSNGWLRTGWVQLGKGTGNPDGNTEKHWSYFGSNGWLRTDWVQFGKGTAEPDGNTKKHWSYFGSNGWLKTGWVQLGKGTGNPDGNTKKHWSYFGEDGWLRTGWIQFGKGTAEPDGNTEKHWSYFGKKGWLYTDRWYTDSNGLHWFDKKGWLAANNPVLEGQLYNDKNGNGVLTKNTTKTGWHQWNSDWYWLEKGVTLKGFNGVTQINNQGTWYHIKDGKTNGPVKNEAIVVHASADERINQFTGGKAGDQRKGEVAFRTWYNRPWHYVFRAKDPAIREKIVYAMERAALNEHIGYDMDQRDSLYYQAEKVGWDPGKVTVNCETDCSALVAVAMRYAGFSADTVRLSIGTCFTTSTMRQRLQNTGKFITYSSDDYIKKGDNLIRGDILVLENGHTAVVSKSAADMK